MEPLRPGDPEQIGGYECVARLGVGGMGQVFLAQADDGRLVALKLIHPDLAEDPVFRARFAREATAMRRVSGPYTASLLDTGESPRPWLATVYLPGLSLDEAVARHGPLSVEATRLLGAALAEALDAIHTAGVVHRDLKPGNILLTADGPRVVDFGIAGGGDFGTADGSVGSFAGTPGYMAPEQLTGGRAGFAADVFALGGVLAFCRTGGPPVLDRVEDEDLRAVIAACRAEDPARRPEVRQLAATLSPGPVGTSWLPPPLALDITSRANSSPVQNRPSPAGHGRRRALLIAGMGAAALASAGVVRALTSSGPRTASVRWNTRVTLVTGYELGPERDGGLFLIDRTVFTRSGPARLDLCRLDAGTGRPRWRRPLTPFEPTRGGVVAALGTVWVRSHRELHAIDPETGAVRWSRRRPFPGLAPAVAHGDALVYDITSTAAVPREAGMVYAHEPRTGRVAWQRQIDGRPVGPIVVDGGVVYVVSASARRRWERVHALDAATGAVRWTSTYGDDVIRMQPLAPRYTDASLRVADGTVYISFEGRLVHALDARTGAARWRIRPQLIDDQVIPEAYRTAAFPVAAGNTLFLGTGDGMLRAFDRRNGRQRWAAATGAPSVAVGVFRRRFTPLVGHGLVFVHGADTVRALRADDGQVRWEHKTDPSAGGPVLAGGALHVPGKWEVTSHDPTSGRVIQRLDLRGRRPPTAVIAGRDALYVLAGTDTVLAIGLPE